MGLLKEGLISEGAYNWNKKSISKCAIAAHVDQNMFFYLLVIELQTIKIIKQIQNKES